MLDRAGMPRNRLNIIIHRGGKKETDGSHTPPVWFVDLVYSAM
jgi:hypothetical protein